MSALNTIEDLASAIWGKLNKVVSVPGVGTRLSARAIRTFASPKRAAKPKRKAAAKSKRKPVKRAARKQPTR